jgi:hypothetical protein
MGLERTVLSLWKHQKETDEFIETIHENDSREIEFLKGTPLKFVLFGDNIDESLVSPPMFEKYLLPWYKKKTAELHEAGITCVSHWDGHVKKLIHYAMDTGLDALECVPPAPMGNITLEELHDATKGMVLFDALPANHFLKWVSKQELRDFTTKALELFSPKIILGISDQLPPNGDIDKVRMISEIANDFVL